jgi:hypothetical protein
MSWEEIVKIIMALATALSCCWFASPAAADAIVSTTGDLMSVPQPATLDYNGSFNDSGVTNPLPIIFNEYTNHLIPTFSAMDPSTLANFGLTPVDLVGLDYLPLDISFPGTYPPDALTTGQINSGTLVSTYIIHFEPESNFGSSWGSVTFNEPVLGIELGSGFSLIREELFDLPNISLVGSSGFEICTGNPNICDIVSLSSDLHTVSFLASVQDGTDDMRIFLAVPEPSTLSIFGMSLLGIWRFRCRRLRLPAAS